MPRRRSTACAFVRKVPSLDVVLRRFGEEFLVPAAGKNFQPSDSNLLVGPLGDDIGSVAEDQMKVVAHHGAGQHIDPEDGSEGFHASANPLTSERKSRPESYRRRRGKPSDAALDRVNNIDFVGDELIGPSRSTHGTSLKKRDACPTKSANQEERKQKTGGTFRTTPSLVPTLAC